MPNPQSRFYAMQETRHYSKWTKGYIRDVKRATRRGDHVSAGSHAEIAHNCAVKAAHWARVWKSELKEEVQ